MMGTIEIHETEDTNAVWKKRLAKHLAAASQFEIHCWNEETQEIDMALQFGTIQKRDWNDGKIISGCVTQRFTEYLLSLPKPTDCEIYDKQTPFFSIFLDDGFSSEHYGTEWYQTEKACVDTQESNVP